MNVGWPQRRNKTEPNKTNNIFNNETCQKAIINRWHFPYWVAKVKFNNNTTSATAKSKLLLVVALSPHKKKWVAGWLDGWVVVRGQKNRAWKWGKGGSEISTRRQHVNNENWHADINTRTWCRGPRFWMRSFPNTSPTGLVAPPAAWNI